MCVCIYIYVCMCHDDPTSITQHTNRIMSLNGAIQCWQYRHERDQTILEKRPCIRQQDIVDAALSVHSNVCCSFRKAHLVRLPEKRRPSWRARPLYSVRLLAAPLAWLLLLVFYSLSVGPLFGPRVVQCLGRSLCRSVGWLLGPSVPSSELHGSRALNGIDHA